MTELSTINIPDLGEVEEAEVIEICVELDQKVDSEDPIMILETDKAAMEIPASVDGVVKSIKVSVGDMAKTGMPFVDIETAKEESQNKSNSSDSKDVEQDAKSEEPPLTNTAINEDSEIKLKSINVPDLGEVEEAEVIEICVELDQKVDSEDPIMILETDKAAMEIPASVDGVVKSIKVSVGDMAKTGMPFVDIEIIELNNAIEKNLSNKTAQDDVNQTLATQEKSIEKPLPNKIPSQISGYKNSSIHSGPATRKLAREFGINLNEVAGSGPKGRILKEDLHLFVSNKLNNNTQSEFKPIQPDIDFSKWGEVKINKLSKFQKTASKNLHTSWINIPHVTQHDDADITALLELRKKLNTKYKTKVSPLAYIIKATVETLKLFPIMNTSLTSDLLNIVQKNYFNIGVAVDTPDGLIVPNIKNVQNKTVLQISDEVFELATQAKDRKLKVDQLKGATFTISSLSGIGGKYFTPIINPPEVGILGLSKTFDHLSLENSEIKVSQQMPVSLSYDHRVINGAYAARFITEFSIQLNRIQFLEDGFNDA
ncbi:2-oxo acid dehydrogenase subunit E2 [Gammaproteobacteria bacterium]|nr:2-oxo acid dehydrogenase subunit E2 [Gammaproteobacteria bacterium]MDC0991177.1 2-oxo acid dehydrogenase subunit E2 [Gammaproteobacteria bacterium]MDC3306630.1 2-oxo acid dehydrogenase subunit E2 [Gammaproteobacteria bacterium]